MKAKVQYIAATGSPFSNKDAEVIGRELRRIAEANACENIRQLDKHLVLDEVLANKKHPLRRFYNWDVNEAAKAHWLRQTGDLIRGVRVVAVTFKGGKKTSTPEPMFVNADEVPRFQGNKTVRRTRHVFREDALTSDPIFISALSKQVKRIEDAVRGLEALTASRKSPQDVEVLAKELRAAFVEYASLKEQAAE